MANDRTPAQEQIADLLRTARSSLGLSLAFLSRLEGDTQHLEVVESAIPLLFKDGQTQVRSTSFCQRILDGALPPVIPSVKDFPEARALPAAKFPRIRSYLSVPVVLSDGTLYGTFCAAGFTADRDLQKRDQAVMEILAKAAAHILEPEVVEARVRDVAHARLDPILQAGGPLIVYQPIVDLRTGVRVGAEALSRFPVEWQTTPDVVFAEAHRIGEGVRLERQAIERAASYLADVPGYVGMNLSPDVLMDPGTQHTFAALPVERISLELSEHDPVRDYGELAACLGPWRERGMRLAIDDVGAGFSSLRHIVLTRPDSIKFDRSIVDGVHADPVLTTLIRSLVAFARDLGATTVAEGIETAQDAEALAMLEVDLGQGWFFGRPGPPLDLIAPDASATSR